MSSVYSIAVPSAFIVNLFKGGVPFGLLELAVRMRHYLLAQRLLKHCKVSTKR